MTQKFTPKGKRLVVTKIKAEPKQELGKFFKIGDAVKVTGWAKGKGFEGHGPKVNASLAPGKWQTFDVIFRAPRFDASGKKIANAKFVKVVHNGKVVHENVDLTGPTRAAMFGNENAVGPIMLQGDHGPVAYRSIRIKSIRLAE